MSWQQTPVQQVLLCAEVPEAGRERSVPVVQALKTPPRGKWTWGYLEVTVSSEAEEPATMNFVVLRILLNELPRDLETGDIDSSVRKAPGEA